MPLVVLGRLLGLVLTLALLAGGCGDDERAAKTQDRRAAAALSPTERADIPAIVDRLSPSVVAVLAESDRGRGEGSGVVWSADGVIVTNHHVVAGARRVQVRLASGKALPARVVASDPRTDLAVLRVEGERLPAAVFAEGLPRVGELAVAIGNPLGFEGTATAGIVSGLDRALPTGGQTPALVGLIQTDAPISPGNSGGALVDARGRVIGINVAYVPPAAGAVALGFAIPAPRAQDVVRDLLADGKVDHPYLGLALAPVPPGAQERLGAPADAGAVVTAVAPDGPAEAAGVRPGDVIVAIGDRDVEQVEDVYAALRERDAGERIAVRIARAGGEPRELTVRLGELPSPTQSAAG